MENGGVVDDDVILAYYRPFWYGFAFIVLSVPLLIITVLVAIAIRRHESYSMWASYQIMFYISLCDITQLTAQQFGGMSLMFDWEMPNLLNMVLGSMITSTWISSSIYGILLALHRLFIVVFPVYEKSCFTGKTKAIIFSIAHSIIPILTVSQWTKWSQMKFYRKDFSWRYDLSLPYGNVFFLIDLYSVIPFILCSFVCYSLIFYTIRKKGSTDKTMENIVTVNVFVYCVFCAVIFILWKFIGPLLDLNPIVRFWISLPWTFYNGANGIICICFNRTVRENVHKSLQCLRINPKQTLMKIIKKLQIGARTSRIDSVAVIYKRFSSDK